MIEFVEREPFISTPTFSPTRQKLLPVWMIKDGAEYFMGNIPIEGGSYGVDYHRQDMERRKAQLLQNGGRYFKMNGQHDDPEEMLTQIAERGHTFDKPADLFLESPEGHYGAGFVDFLGNRREVSAAFHYRIFDSEYADRLREQVKPITERKGRNRK